MGGVGSGRKKTPNTQLRDAIEAINVEEIVNSLKEWAKGKEIVCPHCNRKTGAYTADTVALQSAIELLNRRLGKPAQKHELDITQTLQLNADQIDILLEKHFDSIVGLLSERYPQIKLLTSGENDIIETDV